jgi:16S rRNA G527 N7-methylase RsmG
MEKLWDQIKDVLCNRAFASIEKLQAVVTRWLEAFPLVPKVGRLSDFGARSGDAGAGMISR